MSSATPTADARARMIDQALKLLSERGLAAVTHRSVETAVGVTHGSVTYWFGNRDGLVNAIIDRLVVECEAQVHLIADDIASAYAQGGEPDIELVARAVARWIDDGREQHLARLELELAAIRDERIRARMEEAARLFWRICESLVAALGSDDPVRDGRAMGVMIDGLLLDRLARPPQPDDVLISALRQLLTRRGEPLRAGRGVSVR